MASFSRIASIAYLLTFALPSALSDSDHCNLNDTLTLNLTWDITSCTRDDGVQAYTDPAGGCCVTLDIETCTAHESCIFVSYLGACGTCLSVEYINSEFSTNGTTCDEVSAEFVAENPFADALISLLCDASESLDCCYEGNLGSWNYTSDCDGLDAEECVVDGVGGECSLWYSTTDDCYNCVGSVMPCGELQTFVGNSSDIRVYCNSDNVGDAAMCVEGGFTTTWPAETETDDIETTMETTEPAETDDTETTEPAETETDNVETSTTTTSTTTTTTEEEDTTTTEVESSAAKVYVVTNMLPFVSVALFMVTF
jgi:hypothetical protein